jgi:hypothetical protein
LKGRGTVATGRVEQGTIKVGEEVEILGLSKVKSNLTIYFLLLVKHFIYFRSKTSVAVIYCASNTWVFFFAGWSQENHCNWC